MTIENLQNEVIEQNTDDSLNVTANVENGVVQEEDTGQADGTAQQEDQQIQGDEQPKVGDTVLVKRLRSVISGLQKKNQELERQLQAFDSQTTATNPSAPPTLEQHGWNEQEHAQAMVDWAKKQVVQTSPQGSDATIQNAIAQYHALANQRGLNKGDQVRVLSSLGQNKVIMLLEDNLNNLESFVEMVASLIEQPEDLVDLSGEQNLITFANKVNKITSKGKTSVKPSVQPEKRVVAGNGASKTEDNVTRWKKAHEKGDYKALHDIQKSLSPEEWQRIKKGQ